MQRGFTVLEVVLAVSLGVILLASVGTVFTVYRTQTNYSRAKMLLAGARSNITMYRYRKGKFPDLTCDSGAVPGCSSICTNTDDQIPAQAFFPGTTAGALPTDPVKNVGRVNDSTSCLTPNTWDSTTNSATDGGGWLYDSTLGVLRINLLDNEATYGVAEEQPQPTIAPGTTTIVGGW